MFNPFELRRFSASEVVEIMSPTNRYYASQSLGREATAEELIGHYARNVQAIRVVHFNVDEPEDAFFYPERRNRYVA